MYKYGEEYRAAHSPAPRALCKPPSAPLSIIRSRLFSYLHIVLHTVDEERQQRHENGPGIIKSESPPPFFFLSFSLHSSASCAALKTSLDK